MEHRQYKLAALMLAGLMATGPLAADANDIQGSMEDLRSSLGAMAVQVNGLEKDQANAIQWGVNTDLRYDYSPYVINAAQNNLTPNKVGMYAKRVELEATGKISSWAVWNLQFEFAGLKLEDLGVDAKGLDLLPFVPVTGYDWEAKVGLYRQPFGIENQTGSSSIPFPERAIIDGGYTPINSAIVPGMKIVFERVMGVQLITSHNYGSVGYKLQVAVANNVKDQDAGYTSGTDSMGLTTDQDPSEIGRLGLDLNFIPGTKLNLGASALHNSENTALMTSLNTQQAWSDNVGLDGTLVLPAAETTIWAEWVSQNKFANTPNAGAFKGREEGWYATATMKPLAFFNQDWSNVELSERYEKVMQNVDSTTGQPDVQANTIGLKYLYAGKNYTSVNYTAYALNGQYSTLGPDSLLSVQQQFNF